jgi:hypothetical protein
MYLIKIDDRVVTASTWEGVVRWIRDRYPDAEIGHDGDMEDGGTRTLCWADEADAVNDDGAKAIATITRVHDADD